MKHFGWSSFGHFRRRLATESWKRLYEDYGDAVFRDARMAAATTGEALDLGPATKSADYFERHAQEATASGGEVPDAKHAFALIQKGIIAASRIWNDSSLDFLSKAEQMTFESLQALVLNVQKRTKSKDA